MDIVSVIRGVIDAESGAIEHYNRIIEESDGVDWAPQDMVIEILRDEEGTAACSRASCASARPTALPEYGNRGSWMGMERTAVAGMQLPARRPQHLFIDG